LDLELTLQTTTLDSFVQRITPQASLDGEALNPDGSLKEASEIQWFNSPSDKTSIQLPLLPKYRRTEAVTDEESDRRGKKAQVSVRSRVELVT